MTDNKTAIASKNEKPAVSAIFNLVIIVATLIFPIIGIAMGFTYYRKPGSDEKKAGKIWLILGIIMMIVNILLISLITPAKNI